MCLWSAGRVPLPSALLESEQEAGNTRVLVPIFLGVGIICACVCVCVFRISGSSGTITIKCKDLRVLQLDFPGMEQCLNIARSIEV